MLKKRFSPTAQFFTSNMLAAIMVFSLTGCGEASKKADFEKLIKSSNRARSIGHEDLAANDLKEALELLPPQSNSDRTMAVNLIYPEILALAADLRKSGRLSLSNTMYDRAIEIENDCTLPDKASAASLKKETEKMFDIEENILAKATSTNDLRAKEEALEATTNGFKDSLSKGDYEIIHKEGMKHFERVRLVSGEAGQLYEGIRKVVLNALKAEDKYSEAIALLKRDVKDLDTFSQEDLKNADTDSIQNAYYLSSTLCDLAKLEAASGDLQEAEANARRALRLATLLGGKMVQEKAFSQIVLSDILRIKGQNEQALALAKSAFAIMGTANFSLGYRARALAQIAKIEAALGNKDGAQKVCDSIFEMTKQARAVDDIIDSLAVAAVYFQTAGNEKKFLQTKELLVAKTLSPKAPYYANEAAFEMLGDSSRKLSRFSEALGYYQQALKYSSKEHTAKLGEKIAECKQNRR